MRFLTSIYIFEFGSISPRYSNFKKAPRRASHRGVRLRGVHHPAESDSAVCIIPRSQTPRCASHCGVMKTKHLKELSGVHPTAESDSAVCIIPRSQ